MVMLVRANKRSSGLSAAKKAPPRNQQRQTGLIDRDDSPVPSLEPRRPPVHKKKNDDEAHFSNLEGLLLPPRAWSRRASII